MNTRIPNFEQDDGFQQKEDLEDRQIREMQEEIELLREQVESLKQQLSYSYEFARECLQELDYRNKELDLMNAELSNFINSHILSIDEARELGKSFLVKKKSTREPMIELLNAIDCSPVKLNELARRDQSSFDSKFAQVKSQVKSELEKIVTDSRKIATHSKKIRAHAREIRQQIDNGKATELISQYSADARLHFREIEH